MKKTLATGLAVLTILPSAVFAAKDVTITYNGETLKTDVPAVIKEDRTFVPLRFLSEALGYKVSWDNESRTAIVAKDGEIRLPIGKTTANVKGEDKSLDVAPYIEKDRTMVPLRFVTENLDGKITWDNETRTVAITGPEKAKVTTVTVKADGKTLSLPAVKSDDQTLVSLGDIVKSLGKGIFPSLKYDEVDFQHITSEADKHGVETFSFLKGAETSEFAYYPEYNFFHNPAEAYSVAHRPLVTPVVVDDKLYVSPELVAYLLNLSTTTEGDTVNFTIPASVDKELIKKAVAKSFDPKTLKEEELKEKADGLKAYFTFLADNLK